MQYIRLTDTLLEQATTRLLQDNTPVYSATALVEEENIQGLLGQLSWFPQPQPYGISWYLPDMPVRLDTGTLYQLHLILDPEGKISMQLTHQDQLITLDNLDILGKRWFRLAQGHLQYMNWSDLHIALVGIGRNGSLLARTLAQLGVKSFIFIDPDSLKTVNLEAMIGVDSQSCGQAKASALARYLINQYPDIKIEIITKSITSASAFAAMKQANLIIHSSDHDAARLACGIYAAQYLLPLLDIGSGIYQASTQVLMGGDIRLLLPGEHCLWCQGGVSQPETAIELFFQHQLSTLPWYQQRQGSLLSLNQLNVHYGLLLLQRYLTGKAGAAWLQLHFNTQGIPEIQTVSITKHPQCPLCQLTAYGDQGQLYYSHLAEQLKQKLH